MIMTRHSNIFFCLGAAAFLLISCSEKELTLEQAYSQKASFPELDTEMPEPDFSLQKKSPKRGICTLFQIPQMPVFLESSVSWCYDWGHNFHKAERRELLADMGIEYVPMVWGAGYNFDNLMALSEGGATYLLGYNEPNLNDQAKMTPAQAAKSWPNLVSVAKSLGYKIVGPAVNYGTLEGYGDPVKWYDDFLAQPNVNLEDIDAIAVHAYMPGGINIKQLMIRKFAKYGKPLWLTEFANPDAKNPSQQAQSMQEMVAYLEADPAVERYAWFMDTITYPQAPHFPLVTGPELGTSPTAQITDLGVLYANLSTYDKETYYPADHNIPAESYSGQIEETSAGTDKWGALVQTRITSDMEGTLEIFGLQKDYWVEYNVNVPHTGKYRLDFRYSSENDVQLYTESELSPEGIVELPRTGKNTWMTYGEEVVLAKGRQTIRVIVMNGTPVINWLRITSPTNR